MDEKQQRLLKEMMKFSKLTPSSSVKTIPSGGASSSVKTTNNTAVGVDSGIIKDRVSSMQQQRDAVPSHQLHPQAVAPMDIVHLKVHNREDVPVRKTPTPSKGTNTIYSSDTHFSGSAFMSSPDPSAIPLPVFDLDDDYCREQRVNDYDIYSEKGTGAVPIVRGAVDDDHDQMRRTRKPPPPLSAKKGPPSPPAAAVQIESPTSSHNKDTSSVSAISVAVSASSEESTDKSSVLKRFLKIRQQI